MVVVLLRTVFIRPAGEQSEQRSEQNASAQEAAMVTVVMMMVAMAMTATEDHVPQGQDSKQTQHFVVPPFFISYRFPRYVYRIT